MRATGAKALGRQFRSDEPQARRPTGFTPIRSGLEGGRRRFPESLNQSKFLRRSGPNRLLLSAQIFLMY